MTVRPPKDFPAAYRAADDRYDNMVYRRCGNFGLQLPAVSLGLWHNFGEDTPHEVKRAICQAAFDHGITHFDLANNYGPPPGRRRRRLARFCGPISPLTAMS